MNGAVVRAAMVAAGVESDVRESPAHVQPRLIEAPAPSESAAALPHVKPPTARPEPLIPETMRPEPTGGGNPREPSDLFDAAAVALRVLGAV